ncbi:hypothetical protein [Mesorhizobium sp.]|uniref:hypothetical protein n=1 Tax=Mesorhizobium sp. TaxID=1871066 RepID=UPI003BAD9399
MWLRSTDHLISELTRASGEIDGLTKFERGRLLRRAASAIRARREVLGRSAASLDSDPPVDIVFDLEAMASLVDIFPAAKVSSLMLEAVDCIKPVQATDDASPRI